MEKFKNQVIVITGGCGLLGATIAEELFRKKEIVIVTDIDKSKGINLIEKLKEKYPKLKNNIEFIEMDITSKESINNCINYLNQKYGKIDALVNSAYPRNKNYGKKFEEVTYRDFCENINLHLGGYFLTCQQFALFFKNQGYGNIINFASIYGVIAPRFEIYEGTNITMPVEYAVIKSGIIHLTKYMAKYFKNCNIRFNCISPGGIIDKQPEIFLKNYKKFTLNKGMLNTKDILGTVIFLLSEESKYINGQNIVIDDGFSL